MDSILVCNICSFHRARSVDDKQTHRIRPIIPSQDITHRRRCLRDFGMAHPCACDRFIFASCRDASCINSHRSFCNSRSKLDCTFFPGIRGARRLNDYRREHVLDGDCWSFWWLLCLQAAEKHLSPLVLSRAGRVCGKYPDIPDNSTATCTFS